MKRTYDGILLNLIPSLSTLGGVIAPHLRSRSTVSTPDSFPLSLETASSRRLSPSADSGTPSTAILLTPPTHED